MSVARYLDGNATHDEWPKKMEDFYREASDDELVRILLRDFYCNPFSHYDKTMGEHMRAILASRRVTLKEPS